MSELLAKTVGDLDATAFESFQLGAGHPTVVGAWTRSFPMPTRRTSSVVLNPHGRYDLNALFAKAFGEFTVNVQGLSRGMFPLKAFYWGQGGARDNYSLQVRNIVEHAHDALGEHPVIVGECGIPMDMNLWTYNPSNTDLAGDDWNGENFSWFSRRRALPRSLLYYEQHLPSLDNGARILPSIVRPYPAKTAGIPGKFDYEMNTGGFVFEWRNAESEHRDVRHGGDEHPSKGRILKSLETEIFLPSLLTDGRKVIVQGLDEEDAYFHDERRQTLFIVARDTKPGRIHRISVSLYPPLSPVFAVNDFWSDFGPRIVVFAALVIGIFANKWLILVARALDLARIPEAVLTQARMIMSTIYETNAEDTEAQEIYTMAQYIHILCTLRVHAMRIGWN
ncbi:hypothetical protein C0993_005582 [Termitomyces sp. T159_Od127]|nr:hypothetical protein C0993_005582 [Termitomyces sp. T159_Od127]